MAGSGINPKEIAAIPQRIPRLVSDDSLITASAVDKFNSLFRMTFAPRYDLGCEFIRLSGALL
jgi:hypothetical protein